MKQLLAILMILPAFALGQGLRAIGLQEAIALALAQNRELALSASLLRGQELGMRAASADFETRIRPSGTAGFGEGSEDFGGGIGIARKFRNGTDVELRGRYRQQTLNDEEENRGGLAVEITQPLFRNYGRAVHEEPVIAARERMRAARRILEAQKADLVVEVVDAFARLIRYDQQIKADELFAQRMDQLHKRTSADEQLGESSKLDVLRVELQKGQSEARLANSRELRDFTMRAFSDLLGFPPETNFTLMPPPVLKLPEFTTAEAVAIALGNRMDYAQLLDDLGTADRGVHLARRRLKPDISLISRYERFGEGPQSQDAFDFNEDGWFVGVRAGSDLNPTRERVSVGQAELNHEVAGGQIRLREIAIARSVQQQISAWRRAEVQVLIAERNMALARRQAEFAKSKVDLGGLDTFLATEAEEQWIEAENDLAARNADVLRAGYRLLRVMGLLIEYPADLLPEVHGK